MKSILDLLAMIVNTPAVDDAIKARAIFLHARLGGGFRIFGL